MPTSLEIYFDVEADAYYPGQTLSGRVVLMTTKPKKVRGEFHIYSEVIFKTFCKYCYFSYVCIADL